MSGRRMSSRSRSATIEDKIEITEGMRFDAIRDEEPAVTDMRSQKVDFEKRLRLAGFGDNPNVILGDLAILTGGRHPVHRGAGHRARADNHGLTRRYPLYQYYEGGPDRPRPKGSKTPSTLTASESGTSIADFTTTECDKSEWQGGLA